MYRYPRALALCAALAVTASAAQGQTTTQPRTQSPQATISAPFLLPVLGIDAPVLFQWMPVAPASGYRVHITAGRRVVQATTLVAVQYEMQISRNMDFSSDVLYDRIVDSTSFLFENNPAADPYFVRNPEATNGLSDGTYFWRVRALFSGPVSPYSSLGTFTLRRGISSAAVHDVGVTSITLAGTPIVGRKIPIVARVSNLGSFDESGRTIVFAANGVVIGTADIPTLRHGADPRRFADMSVTWTPTEGPLAAISVQIGGTVDQDMRNNTVTQTTFVASEKPVVTTLVGKLVAQQGGWAITDAADRVVATLVADGGAKLPFASLSGKRVEAHGGLKAQGADIVLVVTTLTAAPAAPR